MPLMEIAEELLPIFELIEDPEIPVLNVLDLGIVRSAILIDGCVEIRLTPTYSGCPAMDMIAVNIQSALQQAGYKKVNITMVLAPSWTTDWLRPEARKKLLAYGIVPPMEKSTDKSFLSQEKKRVPCPRCDSTQTELLSLFGSTACKSLYRCMNCLEPFDYFKCH